MGVLMSLPPRRPTRLPVPPVTLVHRKLYFGIEAMRLRESAARVLTRLHGLPPERAIVKLDALLDDFRIGAAASQTMVEEMVRRRVLLPLAERGEYAITDRFRELAQAELVEPLTRAKAKMVLDHIAELAWHFNRAAQDNKYEIDALAAFGAYMRLEPDVSDLQVAVTGRHRPPPARPALGRGTRMLKGHEEIRRMIEGQSRFVRAHFVRGLDEVPRPFAVIFKSSG
jgi:hypothetical protein